MRRASSRLAGLRCVYLRRRGLGKELELRMTLLGWKNLFHLYLNMRFLSAVKSVVRLSTGIGSSLAASWRKKSKRRELVLIDLLFVVRSQ